MEPRPPSHRPAPDGAASRHSHPGDTGSYQTPDPTTIVAPPRADYDYSPLDLAPSGQRRRRQLVAGALGALVAIMLAGAVVFAFLLLQDDEGDGDDSNSIAAAQTEVAQSRATVSAQETVVANAANGTETPGEAAGDDTTDPAAATDGSPEAAGDDATEPPADSEIDEAGDTTGQAPEATGEAPDESQALVDVLAGGVGGSPSEEDLIALLPESAMVPQGLGTGTDATRTEAEVAGLLGGSREAETNLETWGWSGNAERSFISPDPSTLAPEAVGSIVVSVHGFADEQAAAAALTFYSDIIVTGGYQQTQVDIVGSTSRLLTVQDESGGTTVALYVQDGPVLYRIGGFSQGSDPSQTVIDLANAMLAP